MNKDEISAICEILFNEGDITTKKLSEVGYNSKKINALIQAGIIERVRRGHYALENEYDFVNYIKHRMQNFPNDKSDILNRALNINPNNGTFNFMAFQNCIKKQKFDESIKYLRFLLAVENEIYKKDANMYLFLLSYIIELPEDLAATCNNLKFKDVALHPSDVRFEDVNAENRFRADLFKDKFTSSYKQLAENGAKNPFEYTVLILLKKIYIASSSLSRKLVDFANSGSYREAQMILTKPSRLSKYHASLKKLFDILIDLEDGKMPEKRENATVTNIWDAIRCGDFETAYKVRLTTLKKYPNSRESDMILLLLKRIIDKIESLSFLKPHENDNLKEQEKIENSDDYVKESDEKLIQKRKTELENKCNYLSSTGSFDVIYVKSKEEIREIEIASERIPDLFFREIDVNGSTILILFTPFIKPKNKELIENDSFIDLALMTSKLINNYDIEISQTMSDEEAEYIKTIADRVPGLSTLTIGTDNEKRIVYRAKPIRMPFNINSILIAGANYIKDGDYESALFAFKKALRMMKAPRAFIFYNIAEVLKVLGQRKEALKYYTVALEILKKGDTIIDISPSKIESEIESINKYVLNRRVRVNSTSKDIDLEQIERIAWLTSNEVFSISKTIEQFNLSKEETLLLRLAYARMAYASGSIETAKKMIKEVQKSSDKTTLVNEIMAATLRDRNLLKAESSGISHFCYLITKND